MIIAIDVNKRVEYSLKGDSEPKTVFVFRPLTGAEMLDLARFLDDGKLRITGDYVLELLKKSIVETKNPDKRDIELKTFIAGLQPDALMELVNEAGKLNSLTEDDEKN